MSQENVILDEQGVRVTNVRFLAGGQTYAMSGVTSVRLIKTPRQTILAWFLIFIGFFLLLIPTVYGILILVRQKPPWAVGLTTASGEVNAYFTKDRAFAERVVNALNDAIVARG